MLLCCKEKASIKAQENQNANSKWWLICGFKVCSGVLNFIKIPQNSIATPEIQGIQGFSEFDSKIITE